MTTFHLTTPSLDSQWRSIILFGRNVASYKFALAKSILELGATGKTQLKLDELAPVYSRHVCEHLKNSDKQATSQSSKFLDTCRSFNNGDIDQDSLTEATVRLGFNNVIDAFHVVNQSPIERSFFSDDRKGFGGITLTDEIFQLQKLVTGFELGKEVEARWRLVETAWELDIGRNLVAIQADVEADLLYLDGIKRRPVTSSRDALNGYQKGRCFYCYDQISVDPESPRLADVDHFFPWTLRRHSQALNADGVWNLVLACKDCNRGQGGKMARVPSIHLLERLHTRNNYLIDSHHPLRETLILQTGRKESVRASFLQQMHREAVTQLVHCWHPTPKGSEAF